MPQRCDSQQPVTVTVASLQSLPSNSKCQFCVLLAAAEAWVLCKSSTAQILSHLHNQIPASTHWKSDTAHRCSIVVGIIFFSERWTLPDDPCQSGLECLECIIELHVLMPPNIFTYGDMLTNDSFVRTRAACQASPCLSCQALKVKQKSCAQAGHACNAKLPKP